MIAHKDCPLPFRTDMVKAILRGDKTHTRRVIKLRKLGKNPISPYSVTGGIYSMADTQYELAHPQKPNIPCPYGQVGDRLWVREAWRVESFKDGEPMLFGYKDGTTAEENSYTDTTLNYEDWYERVTIQSTDEAEAAFKQGLITQDGDGIYEWDTGKSPCKWRPSIFMPRWASRITLEITEIRVERLQDITFWDCVAEGIAKDYWSRGFEMRANKPNDYIKDEYKVLWNSLNFKRGYGWDTNPYVWVIIFKVIK